MCYYRSAVCPEKLFTRGFVLHNLFMQMKNAFALSPAEAHGWNAPHTIIILINHGVSMAYECTL